MTYEEAKQNLINKGYTCRKGNNWAVASNCGERVCKATIAVKDNGLFHIRYENHDFGG